MGCVKYGMILVGSAFLTAGVGFGVYIWNTTNYYSSWTLLLEQTGVMLFLFIIGACAVGSATKITSAPTPVTPIEVPVPERPFQPVRPSAPVQPKRLTERVPSKPAYFVSKGLSSPSPAIPNSRLDEIARDIENITKRPVVKGGYDDHQETRTAQVPFVQPEREEPRYVPFPEGSETP